jgi:hypothetical protein
MITVYRWQRNPIFWHTAWSCRHYKIVIQVYKGYQYVEDYLLSNSGTLEEASNLRRVRNCCD